MLNNELDPVNREPLDDAKVRVDKGMEKGN